MEQNPAPIPPQEGETEIQRLEVQTTAARGALPVPGTIITLYRAGSDTPLSTAMTNLNGLTPIFLLPAPPAAASLTPASPKPYSSYTASAQAPGFYTAKGLPITAFGGGSARLTVAMLPLPEGGPMFPEGMLPDERGPI
nr:hypothetical protein [bacterium]